MKNLIIILTLICITRFVSAQTFTNYEYEYSDSVFNNPERGFYKYTERSNANASLDLNTLINYRNLGYTLIYRIFYMRDFVDSPISESYLAKIKEDFNKMREAGIKGIIRFAYTSSMNAPYGDATPERVFGHIAQLKPILTDNSDVIFVLQAGFIGAWGEWYYTDHFATDSPYNITEEDMQEREELVYNLLDAIPEDRMIQLRYVGYKMNFFDDIPLTLEEAYSGSPKSRVSHHNDCFVSSQNDVGSYKNIVVEKAYLEQDTKYTSIGGETCDWYEPRSNCDTTTSEMERFHWSYINQDYYGPTLNQWKESGCFNEILKKIGYRYNLIDAEIQDSSKQNGEFNITFNMENIGYSNPVNPRNVEVVIRNKETGNLYYSRIDTEIRKKELNTASEYSVQVGIPSFVPDGEYEVYLNLPDPRSTLRFDPNFSIRLANKNTWNGLLGMNSFNHTLYINKNTNCSEYTGSNFFVGYSDNQSAAIQVDGAINDWKPVPVSYPELFNSDTNIVKVYETIDTIFFMLKGIGLNPNYQIFLDADNNGNTGTNTGIWPDDSGIDYLIKNHELLYYSNEDDSFNLLSNNVISSVNDSIIEIAVPVNVFTTVKLKEKIRFGIKNISEDETEFKLIPADSENLITHQLTDFVKEPKLYLTSYSENTIVSVAQVERDTSSLILVERSTDPEFGYSTVANLSGFSSTIYFTDNQLDANSKYYYRARRIADNKYSPYSQTHSIITGEGRYKYPVITVDANENDWNAVPPLNSIADGNREYFFKTYTNDTFLNLLLLGDSINNSTIYIDTDNNPLTGENNQNWKTSGFDYKYSEDTIYKYESGEYIEIAKIDSVQENTHALEIKIPLDILNIDDSNTNLNFAEEIEINSSVLFMPFKNRKSSLYQRILPPAKPQGFDVRNSVSSPLSKLIVTWNKCYDCGGYVLTRIDKSTNEVTTFDLQVNENQLIDDGLSGETFYEYFVYSYNYGGNSDTSEHLTSITSGIDDDLENKDCISLWPVPANDYLHIKYLTTNSKEAAELRIYSIDGKLLYNDKITSESFAANSGIITIPTKSLKAGVYLLTITTSKNNFSQKFTKQ